MVDSPAYSQEPVLLLLLLLLNQSLPQPLLPPASKPSLALLPQPAPSNTLLLHSYKRQLPLQPQLRTLWQVCSVAQRPQQAQDLAPPTRVPSSPSFLEAPSYNSTQTSRPPAKTSNRSSDRKTA